MKRLLITLAAVATFAAAPAQQWGGLVMDKDIMMPHDLFQLSQTQFNFGTARSMAMAGAFTSLGADMASMSINPAGLGMYRRNEVSITPMMSFTNSSTNAPAYGKNSSDRFSLSNFGVSIHAYEGTGALTSLNIGFGYNRLSDLNYTYSSQRQEQNGTIADVYARQLAWGGVSKNDFYKSGGSGAWNWGQIDPSYWPNALAYRAFMVDQTDANDPQSWKPTWIGNDAAVGHFSTVESRGSIGEFNISAGANFGNKFYLGASIGILSIYQKQLFDYAEEYRYSGEGPQGFEDFGRDPSLNYQLLFAKMNQAVIIDGTGVNFKLGFIYRPIEGLRIGAAIHTPSYYSLDRRYQAAAAGTAYANNHTDPNVTPDKNGFIVADAGNDPNMVTPELRDEGSQNWSFTSPTRLMFGVSYAFGSRAVISVDYERDWYNGIRMGSNPGSVENFNYNDTFRNEFKGSNTVRVGAEFKPLPMLALRAGFGYNGNMLKDKHAVLASPAVKQMTYYGAGIGFSFSPSVYLDLAYQYVSQQMTDYQLFYASDDKGFSESAVYKTDFTRHNVALTLGFRF